MQIQQWQELGDSAEDAPVLARRPLADSGELDITPMIDITFLMLIFFLVATARDPSTHIELPAARHGVGIDLRESAVITVAARPGGGTDVYIGDGLSPESQLPTSVETRQQRIEQYVLDARTAGKTNVIIKAEPGIQSRHIKQISEAVGRVENMQLNIGVYEAD